MQVLVHVLRELKATARSLSAFPSFLVLPVCEVAAETPDMGYVSLISEPL